MENLLQQIEALKNSGLKDIVDRRLSQFAELGKRPGSEIFKELSFCILTANFNALRSIEMQRIIGDGFLKSSQDELERKLKVMGHRFPAARAKYIVEAREKIDMMENILHSSYSDEAGLREIIVKSFKGLGYKEASHFLRNIGYRNYAIIDFHIVDLLARNNLIQKPKSKSLTDRKYLEIEGVLRELANRAGMNLAELDLYLWYLETGKVLK